MKTTLTYAADMLKIALCFSIFFVGLSLSSSAQDDTRITVYQYRQVPNDKVDEFIKRETTYWHKVAEKAFEKGNLTFWALFQKVGGYDMPNSSNFLFINTYNDVDNIDNTWDAASVFPDVPMEKMETNSMSKVTSMIFLAPGGWQNVENAVPDDQYKYLSMVYHQSSNPSGLAEAENKIWGPFIKTAMDNKQTKQVAWGNSVVISPVDPDMKFNSVSFDIYPSLQSTLRPSWDENLQVPENMTEITELENGPRMSVIYRIVDAVSVN